MKTRASSLTLALIIPALTGTAGCRSDQKTGPTAREAAPTRAPAGRQAPRSPGPSAKKAIPVVRIAGRDWGYPSPYAFYPRGPGYVRMTLLFDTLAWRDEKGLVPWLATKWQPDDSGRKWTVELARAAWHDGKPLTAEDVKFTFDYLARFPHPWFDRSMIEGVEVIGPQQVRFELTRPYAVFETRILMRIPIIPRHVWKDVANPHRYIDRRALIGSGPFVLEKYDRVTGSYIFAANDKFFKGRPTVQRLVFVPTKTAALALLKGEVDMTRILKVDSLRMFEGKPEFKIIEAPDYWLFRVVINYNQPLLRRVAFRRALAHAIDRPDMVRRVAHGGAVVGSWGYVSPASEWHNPKTADYPHDPARARVLLDRLKVRDRDGDGVREDAAGNRLLLALQCDNRFARAAEAVRKYLGDIGLAVRIHSVDVSTHDSNIRKTKGFDLALTAHGGVTGDLGNLTGGLAAIAGYQDAEYRRLIAEQPFIRVPAERKRALFRIQEIVARDVATLPLYYLKWFHAFRPAVFDGWFYPRYGLPIGVQLLEKKLAFLR